MKDPTAIAVASRSFSRHPVLREELLSRYSRVRFNDLGETLAGENLVGFLAGSVKAITALEPLDEETLSSLPDLRVVAKYGVGLDMIDLDAMERLGILLGWTGGVNRRSVAELTLSSMIALLHRLPESGSDLRSGVWRQIRGRQLTDKTVGIIGCGNIGKDLIILLKPFGCRILANDIVDHLEFYREHGVIPVGLEELLRSADVVTLHVPLNGSTRNMINAGRMALMKEGACLINMARGGLVDEARLSEMLRERRLGGAALDVFNSEPPDDVGLLDLPNVIMTSHIGGSTEEAVLAMGRAAIDGLKNAARVSSIVPDYLRTPG